MRLKKRFRSYPVSLLFLLVGCVHPQPQWISGEDAMSHFPSIQSLKAKAQISIATVEKTFRFSVNILLKDSPSFFIETLGFGVPQGYASLQNDHLTILFPSNHKTYLGNASSSLHSWLQVHVSPQDLVDVLLLRSRKKEIEYGKSLDGSRYPKNIRLHFGSDLITLTFKEVEIDQPIEDDLFQIDVPSEGFDIYMIDKLQE